MIFYRIILTNVTLISKSINCYLIQVRISLNMYIKRGNIHSTICYITDEHYTGINTIIPYLRLEAGKTS